MEAGLEVIGDVGNVLIDSKWINYALIKKETVVSGNQNGIAPSYLGSSIEGLQLGDLCFVRCSSNFSIVGIYFVNGVRRYGVATYGVGVAVTFYVFRKQPPTASTFGLQVFGGAGELIFDAASQFLKVAYVVPSSELYLQKFHSIGTKTYAVLCPAFCGQIVQQWERTNGQFEWLRYIIVYGPDLLLSSGGLTTGGLREVCYTAAPDTIGRAPEVTRAAVVPLIVADVTGM